MDESLPRTCENLWLRASGAEPWEYDVILTHATDSVWTYKRDSRVTRPIGEILWNRGGVDACLPVLDSSDRVWLREAMEVAHPDHPWLERL
jgi:hypothetical protein